MKGKTRGVCHRCRIVYRWKRSLGRWQDARCHHCELWLDSTPWGLPKVVAEGYEQIDRVPWLPCDPPESEVR